MTVGETMNFGGSHHYGWLPIGWPDDGFGNTFYVGTMEMLHFIWSGYA